MTELLPNTVSPRTEMISYETLWGMRNESFKTIADLFKTYKALPSEIYRMQASLHDLRSLREEVEDYLSRLRGFGVAVNGAFQYPERLRDARYPLELFYYRGDIGLLESPSISIVGARKASDDGLRRAAKLARVLVETGITIVSGLAAGVDTAAMTAAIQAGGRTVGVIGTPINESYPKENRDLQETVALDHLLLSQVPFYRYHKEPFRARTRYFPERNVTMAAISFATVIVEASDTSGTLTQARACLQQGRKLFILNSCFENPTITWPKTFEERGAIRVRDLDDILKHVRDRKANASEVAKDRDRLDGETPGTSEC
jgi:DNA processing protein